MRQLCMASDSTHENSLKASIIVLLMIFQIMSLTSAQFNTVPQSELTTDNPVQSSQSVGDLALDFGSEIAGQYIDYPGAENVKVMYESELDIYHDFLIQDMTNGLVGSVDVTISDLQEISACWITDTGSVYNYNVDLDNVSNLMQVDEVSINQGSNSIIDCAIAVKDNGRETMLYADGGDLKAAQIAYASPLYSNGDDWHVRTILEGINATNIELEVTSEQLEWGLFRDDMGRLHRINYTGVFWETGIIDNGPVGEDFELVIDNMDKIAILFNKGNETFLHTINGLVSTTEAVFQHENMHDDIGLTLDGYGLMQMFSTSIEDNITTAKLQRSLANQKNQISSEATLSFLTNAENSTVAEVIFADFNNDGFDDLVYSEPNADTSLLNDNGIVSVHYGSENGIGLMPNLTFEGPTNSSNLGRGLAVGDFNGDSYPDISLGLPGFDNNNGSVRFSFGSSQGLETVLLTIPGVSVPSSNGASYGSCLESVEDLNSDNKDELLICSIDYDLQGDTGLVELFFGNIIATTWVKMNSPNQITSGSNFGRSISADGDLNGDGFVDLVIGNTGDLTDSSGYSSVELRYGNSMGFASDPDLAFQSLVTGNLFGYNVEIMNDLNDDGLDELFISEPYNNSNEFYSGNVWVFYGNLSGIESSPNHRLVGSSNELLGLNFASAGDTNQDGFNDFFMTRRANVASTNVELYLGSSSGLIDNSISIASGDLSFGEVISNYGDSNADGLLEFSFSAQNIDDNQAVNSRINIHSREIWAETYFTIEGEINHGKVQSSTDGSSRILYSVTTGENHNLQMISEEKNSQGGYWSVQNITSPSPNHLTSVNFEMTSSGEAFILYFDDGMHQRTYDAFVGLETNVPTNYNDASYVNSVFDNQGTNYVVYYSPSSNNLMLNIKSASGWSEQVIATNANIDSDIDLVLNQTGQPVVIYRDDLTNNILVAHNNSGWIVDSLNLTGEVISKSISSVVTDQNNLLISTFLNDGNSNNLTMISWDGNTTNHSFIGLESDGATKIAMAIDGGGTVIVSTYSTSGVLVLYEKQVDSQTWNSVLLPQPIGFYSTNHIKLIGGMTPTLAVNSQNNSLFYKSGSNWQVLSNAEMPSFGEFSFVVNETHITMVTAATGGNNLAWNSMEITSSSNHNTWHHQIFSDIIVNSGLVVNQQSNDTISIIVDDLGSNSILELQLKLDRDSDFIFDDIDHLPYVPNQWIDSDGDGYGENTNAPMNDNCPSQSGQSSILLFGCFDADNDGYDDISDDCNTGYGFSWLGRLGCSDFDQDGWVDWSSFYPYGDIFSDNWKQAFDSDGDSYGDNHGPDCCDTWYDQNAPQGDEFPYNVRQYTDFDGDGYGDNSSDFITGDACKFEYGTSYRDRLGCVDTDGDGSSNPTNSWNSSLGADLWPTDSTQWSDSDGDGFGDNGSKNATNPDYFPNNIAAAQDSDDDGYPDAFTDYYNGTNAEGLQIDGCPLVAGNSSNPYYGCLDTDGDNYRDIYTFDINPNTGLRENQSGDAFPFNPEQWTDADGDGFGDFQGGNNADMCPQAVGVINGTLGIGCPLIDGNDDDGDFVINEEDLCPNTQTGLMVNLDGCALNQVDSDDDGVSDADDVCPSTFSQDPVDSDGCSQVQREVDSDSDGIYDYLDSCENTPSQEVPDEFGCSASQKDTDGDGVADDVDVCPSTELGYPVLADGCIDENALEFDWDSDGYSGQDDLFPFEDTQWFDSDDDGYGDNILGLEGDQCPYTPGTSTEDRFGCPDSDLDGWSDPDQDWAASPSGIADAFSDDVTQWRDFDGDGYGDNGTGNNPDLCPMTNSLYRTSVDLQGCSNNERDSDGDGLVDSLDNCPNEPKGLDGYADGCPLEKQESSSEATEIFGLSILTFVAICLVVVILFILLIILRNRDIDEDWFEEDDDFEEDYQEESLSFLNKPREQPAQRTAPSQSKAKPPRNGPTGGPPSFTSPPKAPIVAPSQPPVSSGKQVLRENLITPQRATKKSKKVKSSHASKKKVKRVIIEPEPDIFEKVSQSKIDAAVKNLADLTSDGDERQLLMNLQEDGWNAPQSRAIINMAKKARN